MKPLTKHQLVNYVILMSTLGSCVEGKARIIKAPSSPLYVASGGTARFVWDYTVDNKSEDFQFFSPSWKYYYANGTAVDIAHEHFLENWKWKISFDTCPYRLLIPFIRVSKENNATLIISNVTLADSGIYEMALLLRIFQPVTSKVQLVVTTRPKFNSQFQTKKIVLEGRDLKIKCSAVGIPTPNITWVLLKSKTRDIKTQGIGYAELFIQNTTRQRSGTYRCRATNNPNEYPVENEIEVTIQYKPQITFLNWTVDESITLYCLASGEPPPFITWYYPNGTQVGDGRIVLKIPPGNTDSYGCYKCNATSEVGWDVGFINISGINRSTTRTLTETTVEMITSKHHMTRKALTTARASLTSQTSTPDLDTKGKSGRKEAKYKIKIIVFCIISVLILILIALSVTFALQRCKQRNDTKDKTRNDANDDNQQTARPDTPNVVTYAQVKDISIYAEMDMSKKKTGQPDDSMPIYAQVDKRKKRRPGQIVYAELEEFKSRAETTYSIRLPPYIAAEYADIRSQEPSLVKYPEPIYEILPDNS